MTIPLLIPSKGTCLLTMAHMESSVGALCPNRSSTVQPSESLAGNRPDFWCSPCFTILRHNPWLICWSPNTRHTQKVKHRVFRRKVDFQPCIHVLLNSCSETSNPELIQTWSIESTKLAVSFLDGFGSPFGLPKPQTAKGNLQKDTLKWF